MQRRAVPPARFPDGIERRAAEAVHADGRRLAGYAAVFDSPATIADRFTEVIKPGAFRASLADANSDPLMLVDHDPSKLLARRSSGTLRLEEDRHGLRFECDVPDTALGRDLLTMVQRGDCKGCSFGFRVTDEAWPFCDARELRAVTLMEISAVHAWAAYDATSIVVRARAAPPRQTAARLRLVLATL